MQYVIQLPTFAGTFLCYEKTNTAVVYNVRDPQLKFDLQITKGNVKRVTGGIFAEIFYGLRYDNILPDADTMRAEYQLNMRSEAQVGDLRQMNLSFEPR